MSVALKDGYAGQEGGGAYRHGVQYVGRLSAHPLLEGNATLHDHTRRQRLAAAVCECAVLVAMHAVQAQPCGRERRRVLRAPLRVEVLRLEEKLYGDLASSMHAPCKLYDRVFCTAAERVSAAVHRGVGGGMGQGASVAHGRLALDVSGSAGIWLEATVSTTTAWEAWSLDTCVDQGPRITSWTWLVNYLHLHDGSP